MAHGFVLIKTVPGKEKSVIIELVNRKIARNIHTVFGEYDIVLMMKVQDYEALGQVVIDHIRAIPGVEDTMTLASCRLTDLPYSMNRGNRK